MLKSCRTKKEGVKRTEHSLQFETQRLTFISDFLSCFPRSAKLYALCLCSQKCFDAAQGFLYI